MKLVIENFAKIKHADIQIDGITVIAGNNNTGKSTIGKTLYSAFTSLYNLNTKIEKQRVEEISKVCFRPMNNFKLDHNNDTSLRQLRMRMRSFEKIVEKITKYLMDASEEEISKEVYMSLFEAACDDYNISLDEKDLYEFADETYEKVMARIKKDNLTVAKELVERLFLQVFSSQIQCVSSKNELAKVSLLIKENRIELEFQDNKCSCLDIDYNILHEAFFIDDPFILDDISNDDYYMTASKGIRGQLKNRILNANDDIMDGIFESVDAKEKLKDIFNVLNKVTEGDIIFQNGQWDLKTRQFNEPFNLENLSAGVKSFVLIRLLLEKAILKEKDVLILDEPEIHLHPEWQLLYAEIVVLLQKEFDLSIVVTTHSMNFLEAIDYYSKKYEMADKCHYYLAMMDNNLATFKDVTDNVDEIYSQMVTPSMLLDKLKYEMENDGEE